ncbi:MAG: PAS domain S-box protein [Endomicrobiales bacterium]
MNTDEKQGIPRKSNGVFKDCAATGLTEQSLRDSEDRLQQVLEVAALGIWGLDLQSGKTWRSLRFEQIFGYSHQEKELSYQLLLEHIVPDDRKEVDDKFKQAIARGLEWNFQCRIRRDDGVIRWIEMKGKPKLGVKSEVTHMIGLVRDITENKEAEEQINDMARLTEESPSPILSITKDHIVQYANKASTFLLTCWHCSVGEAVPADIQETITCSLDSNEKLRRTVSCNETIYSLSFSPVVNKGYVNIYVSDISESMHAAGKLKERAHMLSLAPVFVWTEEKGIIFWNKGLENLYGWTKEEALGMQSHVLLKTIFPQPLEELKSVLSRDKYWSGELTHFKKNGDAVVVASSWVLKDGFDGSSTAIIETDNDITELKETEMALLETRDYLENLFSHASGPIIVWDREFKIIRFNSAFEHLTGYAREEVEKKELHMLFPQNNRNESLSKINRTLAGEYWDSMEIPILRKDGQVRVVLWNSANIYEKDGSTLLSTIAQGQDITDRKNAEEVLKRDKSNFESLVRERTRELLHAEIELENAKRLSDIGALSATVAHELRNPLGVIRTAVYNIRRKSDNPSLNGHINNIEKKIQESDQIINNLLGYSRIKMPHPEKVELYGILDECINFTRERFEKKNLVINKMFEPIKDIYVNVDPYQIREVFNNILDNACQAVGVVGGKVDVSATCSRPEVINIRFKDNGCGIENCDIDKVFEPFFTRKSKGTGLGLTICREMMHLNGGEIIVASKVGKGTTFNVSLAKNLPQ